MNVKEIFTRNPPEILYHYTTQEGLLGIIGNREIWASHTQYLNDVREFKHAIVLAEEEIQAMKSESIDQNVTYLLQEMENAIEGIENINVCVSSFSAAGDVLSQWRAYGGGASGFSIGFSGAFLRAVSDQLDFWLVPVLYDEGEQRQLIRTLLQDVLQENLQERAESDETNESDSLPGGNLGAYLNRYAPILKHRSFSEEREWRIISRPLSCRRAQFGYRPGASMLIPYFRIKLFGEQVDFEVRDIIVGPTPHPEQSVRSIKSFFTKQGLEKARVRNSEVPYRNW